MVDTKRIPGTLIDLTGEVFGRLTVVSFAGRAKYKGQTKPLWNCVCACGQTRVARGQHLRRRNSTSCGCDYVPSALTHGCHDRDGYGSWRAMLDRCYNEASKDYFRWGARGITVCARWRDSVAAFLEDMGPRPSRSHSIDRINNDGNYEPANCRWATPKQQANNRRKK